jgi:aminobenzoyl-glutamate utilization protein B
MKKSIYIIIALGMLFSVQAQNKKTLKKGVIQDVENQKEKLIEISDTLWEAAEIAFQETVSSETLIAYA